MGTIEDYLGQRNTPMCGSPTAMAMRALLKLDPTIPFETAREAVNAVGASLYSSKECAKRALELVQGVKAA